MLKETEHSRSESQGGPPIEPEQAHSSGGRNKPVVIWVPNEVDTSRMDGVFLPSWVCAQMMIWVDYLDRQEAERVPRDSPMACTRCRTQRAALCSVCQEQVCGWCHRPDVDHHDGKVRPLGVHSKTYVMTDLETGALVPHQSPGEDGNDSYFIHEPLPGSCLSCGYDGYVYRLLYRDPEQGAWYKKGVAYEAVCYACDAGNGNLEPVHPKEVP